MSSPSTSHPWRFFRAGGLDQVVLETPDDLLHLEQLDQKLWVALSCPAKGLEFDARTLELLDTDRDGRIRAPELFAAVHWTAKRLRSLSPVIARLPVLPLASINEGTPEGAALLASARRIVQSLGKADASEISFADLTDTARIFEAAVFNGDGVISPQAAEGESRQVIEDILATVGAEVDRGGKPGVSKAKVAAFFGELQLFADWRTAGAALGPIDEAAAEAQRAVSAKLDDFFARLRLTTFDARAGAVLNRSSEDYVALAVKDLGATRLEVESFPLQHVEAGKQLDLLVGVNPAWTARLDAFRAKVVEPLLGSGKTTLSESEWQGLVARQAPYDAWVAAKPAVAVEKLGLERVRSILGGDDRAKIEALIDRDLALAPEFDGIADVERLLHYQRDLFELLRNFVNFTGFYDPASPAIFQSGILYLDQRSCHLCIRVDDPGAHATLATMSRVYVAYCLCTRPSGEKMHVAAAFTQGDSDYLMVGRNGVFYDRQGRDWDATIVKVIDNPISVRQAFWSPYKRFAKIVGDQIEKFAASKDKAVTESAVAGAADAQKTVEAKKASDKEAAFDVARFAGIFAAIGLAIGAIGGALGAMLGAFMSLALWQMPLAVAGIMLVISGPSILIAALKLHQRTLGPLLEGNGWAINGRVRINIPIGTKLTDAKTLPPSATRSLVDPFEDKEAARIRRLTVIAAVLVALAIAAWFGLLKPRYFPPTPLPPAKTVGAP